MKTLGILVLIASVGVLFIALTMDTSVSTGLSGNLSRVNNIGLMNEKQNYLMVGGIGCLAGLLMFIFGESDESPSSTTKETGEDPFDRLDREEREAAAAKAKAEADARKSGTQARREHAVKLGVRRRNGKYVFADDVFEDLEDAITVAEAHAGPDEGYYR